MGEAGWAVEVWDNSGATPRLVRIAPTIAVVPLDPNQPLGFLQKGIYRGNLRMTSLGGTLRVVNVLTWDDYIRGVIPLEMPTSWHPEALKAQAYAARSYGYNSYNGSADYDVSDDQADQCYGGSRVEVASTNAAVQATAGKLITYNNAAIRAYFASSNGGYTLPYGCFRQPRRSQRLDVGLHAGSEPAVPRRGAGSRRPRGQQPRESAGVVVRDPSPASRSAMRSCAATAPTSGTLQAVDLSNRSVPVVGPRDLGAPHRLVRLSRSPGRGVPSDVPRAALDDGEAYHLLG
jgi:hypothetical protein